MFATWFRTLRQSQGQSIVRTVWLYMIKSRRGAGALQKSRAATNRTKSALNAVSSFGAGVSEYQESRRYIEG